MNGYVYMPYLISESIPVVDNFTPKKPIMSKYATKMIDGRYYSIVNGPKQKEIKRIYSELDPYGEEDWED